MLWSFNEVLAYVKDDLKTPSTSFSDTLNPEAAFGGFQTWNLDKEDFVLIAENSEIHGPNPLFTIPELDTTDLTSLSTQILSADYQGLGNNKILPGKNAQLLMPDIDRDTHAAVTYFYLFDSEARGFVRPTCLAYFTSDKHKLIKLAKEILDLLNKASAILQHSNIISHIHELKSLKDYLKSNLSPAKNTNSKETSIEARLRDVQDVLNMAESYEGNKIFDEQLCKTVEYLRDRAIYKGIRYLNFTWPPNISCEIPSKPYFLKPNNKKCMRNLYLICNSGLLLCLYHLYVMHKYFRRKYENIVISNTGEQPKGSTLYFGACVCNSPNVPYFGLSQNKCLLSSFRTPSTFQLDSSNYLECMDVQFQNTLLRYIEGLDIQPSTDDHSHFQNYSSQGSEIKLPSEPCRHIVPLDKIWDTIDHLKAEHPGIESSFIRVLRLLEDVGKLFFALFTCTPIFIISSPEQKLLGHHFVLALSCFIPRKRNEISWVDTLKQDPFEKDCNSKYAAIHFCLGNSKVEDYIPSEFIHTSCILNMKDGSFTSPAYTGCLLADVDQQFKALPISGPAFAVVMSILLKIDQTIKWWNTVSSSSIDMTTATHYVLSKGFNHLDMQIIQTLSRLCKD